MEFKSNMKKKINWKEILLLQISVVIFTFAGVFGKMASKQLNIGKRVFSIEFLTLCFLEIVILVVYGVIWQQIMKRFDLSIAYANKAAAIFWSMLWAVFFFKETITVANVLGSIIIVAGICVLNQEGIKE